MKRFLLALVFILLSGSVQAAALASGAYGFGTTFGTNGNDIITTQYKTTPTGTSSHSVWYFMSANTALQRIFYQGGCTSRCVALTNTTTSVLAFQRGWSTSTSGLASWTIPLPSVGTWHNIVVTYDATSTANAPVIYLDGVSQTVTTAVAASGTLLTGTIGYTVGAQTAGTDQLGGMVAEWATWNGVILTQADATALSKGVSPLAVGPQPPTFFAPLLGTGIDSDWGSGKVGASTISGAKGNLGPPLMGFPLIDSDP